MAEADLGPKGWGPENLLRRGVVAVTGATASLIRHEAHRRRQLRVLPGVGLARELLPARGGARRRCLSAAARPGLRGPRCAAHVRRPADRGRDPVEPPA